VTPEPIDLHHLGRERVIASYLLDTDDGPALFDCGPATTVDALKAGLAVRGLALTDVPVAPMAPTSPHVVLVVGVNGTGKTTTVGKLAHYYRTSGRSVMVCAADTFRAAAVEQLAVWTQRAGVDLIRAQSGADPAAVTFDAVTAKGEYLGGVICPGPQIAADALFQRTARLPRVDVRKPQSVIGHTTVGAIESGLFYGYLGMVESVMRRMIEELGGRATCIATGGLAPLVLPETKMFEAHEPDITLHGLRIIWERNQ